MKLSLLEAPFTGVPAALVNSELRLPLEPWASPSDLREVALGSRWKFCWLLLLFVEKLVEDRARAELRRPLLGMTPLP